MRKQGMTLIELLVYLGIFSLVILMASSWVGTLWISFMRQSTQRTELMTIYSAHDVITRELRAAPSDAKKWKKRESQSIIWEGATHDIGFEVVGDSLIRIEGIFDTSSGAWKKAVRSILAKQIEHAHFEFHGVECIELVSFDLAINKKKVAYTVTLSQRKLPWKIKS